MNEGNFEKLVLPKGHAKIVKSLVQTHLGKTKDGSDGGAKTPHMFTHSDVVQGKGAGLIVLLHGAPGVGKTSTAECIAELTKRPLFPITCGDIGDNAKEVQRNLEQNFHLAHHWNCVLLLDEADVFLAQRERTDLRRNALVSVFLRVLEYYRGILFLTTNRVGTFDDAFKSRIHMSLYYPPLGRKSTIEVWRMNLDEARKRNLAVEDKQIIKFAKKHFDSFDEEYGAQNAIARSGYWNGRQIRNAFQTAIALAGWEFNAASSERDARRLVLRREHFEQVADASYQFDQYLQEVRGVDDAKIAHELGARDDSWRPDPSSNSPWSPRPSRTSLQVRKVARRNGSKDDSSGPSDQEKKSSSKGKGKGSGDKHQRRRKARRDDAISESQSGSSKAPTARAGSKAKPSGRRVSKSDSSSTSSSTEG